MNEFDATLEKTPGFFDKIQESIKKNPMLFIAGAVGIVIFVVAVMPRRQEDMVFDTQQFPVGSPTTPGGVGYDDTELRDLLEESIVGDRDMIMLMDQIMTGQQQIMGMQQFTPSMLEEMMASMAATQPIDEPTVEYNLVVPQGVVSIDPVRPTDPGITVAELKTDIRRVTGARGTAHEAWFAQQFGSLDAYIFSQEQRIRALGGTPEQVAAAPAAPAIATAPARATTHAATPARATTPVTTPAAAIAALDRAVIGDGRRATVAQPVSSVQFPGTSLRAYQPLTSPFQRGTLARAVDIGMQNLGRQPAPPAVQRLQNIAERNFPDRTQQMVRDFGVNPIITPTQTQTPVRPALQTPVRTEAQIRANMPANSVFVTGVTGRPAATPATPARPAATPAARPATTPAARPAATPPPRPATKAEIHWWN